MVMDVHGSHEQVQRTFGRSFDRTRTAPLISALLIGGFAALGIVILANTERQAGSSQIRDCASVRAEAERLACFNDLTRRPEQLWKGGSTPNFRGAT